MMNTIEEDRALTASDVAQTEIAKSGGEVCELIASFWILAVFLIRISHKDCLGALF